MKGFVDCLQLQNLRHIMPIREKEVNICSMVCCAVNIIQTMQKPCTHGIQQTRRSGHCMWLNLNASTVHFSTQLCENIRRRSAEKSARSKTPCPFPPSLPRASPSILPRSSSHLRDKVRGPAPSTEEVFARQCERLLPRVFIAAYATHESLVASHRRRRLLVQPNPHLLHDTLWVGVILHAHPHTHRAGTTMFKGQLSRTIHKIGCRHLWNGVTDVFINMYRNRVREMDVEQESKITQVGKAGRASRRARTWDRLARPLRTRHPTNTSQRYRDCKVKTATSGHNTIIEDRVRHESVKAGHRTKAVSSRTVLDKSELIRLPRHIMLG